MNHFAVPFSNLDFQERPRHSVCGERLKCPLANCRRSLEWEFYEGIIQEIGYFSKLRWLQGNDGLLEGSREQDQDGQGR